MTGDGAPLKPRALFPRPAAPTLDVEREPVDGTCDGCGAPALERYPVLRVTGWQSVVRCPECLHIVSESPAPTPFGFEYVPYGSYIRGAQRAGAD